VATSSRRRAITEGLALGGLLCTAIVLAAYWTSLPTVVAIHVGINGVTDGFGAKRTLLILPSLAVVTYVGSVVAAKLNPSAKGILTIVRLATAWVSAIVTLLLCASS